MTITGSFRLPSVDGTGQAPFQATFGDRPPLGFLENSFVPQAGVGLSWELDFWGRWTRATEAARAELAATEEARHAILSDLVASVASAYLQLRSLDLSLEIARRVAEETAVLKQWFAEARTAFANLGIEPRTFEHPRLGRV